MCVEEGVHVPVRDFFWATVAALLSVLRFTAIAVPASASSASGASRSNRLDGQGKIKWRVRRELLACGGRLARDFVAAGFDILQYNTSSRNSTTRASRTLQSTRTRTPLERDHV